MMTNKPTLNNVPVYRGKAFAWCGDRGTAETSDLGRIIVPHARLWPDACDVGFYIESERTGQKVLFSMTDRVSDDEDGLLYTTYQSVGLPRLVTVTVYND